MAIIIIIIIIFLISLRSARSAASLASSLEMIISIIINMSDFSHFALNKLSINRITLLADWMSTSGINRFPHSILSMRRVRLCDYYVNAERASAYTLYM
jgi:hypothetical protein